MGLDMRFYKRTYLESNKEGEYPDVRVAEHEDWKGNKKDAEIIKKAVYVMSLAGDMRKANAIHKYIIDKCYNGEDPNCKWVALDTETILELKGICEELLKEKDSESFAEKAESLLPTQEGFFFGSTEYDEWYICQLNSFLEMVKDWDFDDRRIDYVYCPWY